MSKRPSAAELAAMTRQTMEQLRSAPPRPKSPTDVALENGISVIRLRVKDVAYYGKNPRTQINPGYAEIRDSIEERGLDQELHVTKRPGEQHYTLARGGKTRLLALQELCDKNPAQWEFHDFLIVPFVSESEMLAAHLVENLAREAMTFWDTANGIVSMREALVQENAGRPLSQRDFAKALDGKGLKVAQTVLTDYLFATQNLAQLGELAQQLVREHVRNSLRPEHSQLQALWLLHQRTEDDFATHYKSSVGHYALTQTSYSLDALQSTLQELAAQALDYDVPTLRMVLAALKLRPNATLAELQTPSPAAFTAASPAEPMVQPSAASAALPWPGDATAAMPPVLQADLTAGHAEFHGGLGGAAEHSVDGSTEGLSQAASLDTQGAWASSEQGLANLAQSLGALGDHGSGLRVARGLAPNPSKHAPLPGDAALAMQNMLSGLNPWELAQSQLEAALAQFADIAGVQYLMTAAALRYGFFMELPKAGVLGSSPEDLAIQGWWFLANLSGQLDEALLDVHDDHNQWLIPDTGEQGYRHAATQPDVWAAVMVESLGGEPLGSFEFMHYVFTTPAHPLGEAARSLMQACHVYQAELQRSQP